jgi:hypothetical protein
MAEEQGSCEQSVGIVTQAVNFDSTLTRKHFAASVTRFSFVSTELTFSFNGTGVGMSDLGRRIANCS